jgi:hypothetical protein
MSARKAASAASVVAKLHIRRASGPWPGTGEVKG